MFCKITIFGFFLTLISVSVSYANENMQDYNEDEKAGEVIKQFTLDKLRKIRR
jgi:hypothetical protein